MAQIGQIIDGKFRILKPVGRGGMSRVYLAQDIHLGKRWVVKEIPKFVNGGKNTLFINAALSEAEIIKSLDHPCIVRIVDVSQDDRAVYIVEDYVEGRSLKEIADGDDPINPTDLRDWAIQLCQVLIYLHSRKPSVIYRDLKPENIILTESGHIKLVDFGIARRYRPEGDRDTIYLGTVQFAAPEQYEEYGAQTDMRTDIYGFGKTLEYLAYDCPELSETVYDLIGQCTMEDPQDRYQSAEELLHAIIKIRDFHRTSKKRKLIICLLSLSVAIIFLFIVLKGSVDHEQDLLSAIRIKLDEIKEDRVFSLQEEEQLLNMTMPYLSELKEMEGFEQTALDIGQLYWDCYAYGSDGLRGVEGAMLWFELAGDDNETAEIYQMIGKHLLASKELDPATVTDGSYRHQLEQLTQLALRAASGDAPVSLKAEICRMAADSLTANIYQYKKDGVSLRDIELLLAHISRLISEVRAYEGDGDSVPLESALTAEQLQIRENSARQAVSLAYPDV